MKTNDGVDLTLSYEEVLLNLPASVLDRRGNSLGISASKCVSILSKIYPRYCKTVKALEEISRQDWRGNCPTSVTVAKKCLEEIEETRII